MKKTIHAVAAVLGTAALLAGFSPSASAQTACATCSNWVLSPDANSLAFGVTAVEGTAQIGASYATTQPQGIYGAGFTWTGGSSFAMSFDADLYTWDSYNATHGYWDAFVVTVSTTGFYWNTAHTDPLPASSSMWVWGGNDWETATLENYTTAPGGPLDSISLSAGNTTYYVSLALDTKTPPTFDNNYASWGSFHVDVSPIPEPETYAMLIAGLGLMGFVARRRQKKALAA
jgi:hypothetical protein